MKRESLRLSIVTLILTFLVSTFAFAKTGDELKLYDKFLKKGDSYTSTLKKPSSNGWRGDSIRFTLKNKQYFNIFDFDDNGVKELIIKPHVKLFNSDDTGPSDYFYVFTVKNGKVVPFLYNHESTRYYIGDKSFTVYTFPNKSKGTHDFQGFGSTTEDIFLYYKKNQLQCINLYQETWDNECKCYINGKPVSEAEYKNTLSQYSKNKKTIKLYDNTKANRKRILKASDSKNTQKNQKKKEISIKKDGEYNISVGNNVKVSPSIKAKLDATVRKSPKITKKETGKYLIKAGLAKGLLSHKFIISAKSSKKLNITIKENLDRYAKSTNKKHAKGVISWNAYDWSYQPYMKAVSPITTVQIIYIPAEYVPCYEITLHDSDKYHNADFLKTADELIEEIPGMMAAGVPAGVVKKFIAYIGSKGLKWGRKVIKTFTGINIKLLPSLQSSAIDDLVSKSNNYKNGVQLIISRNTHGLFTTIEKWDGLNNSIIGKPGVRGKFSVLAKTNNSFMSSWNKKHKGWY